MIKGIGAARRADELFKKVKEQYNIGAIEYTKNRINERAEYLRYINQELKNIPFSIEARELSPIVEKIDGAVAQIYELARELDNPFLLFIMGMGKMGKSTLLNALVGEIVAEENFKPTTWKIDVFYGSEGVEDAVEIYYGNGEVKTYSFEEATRILNEEEEKTKQSRKEVLEQFNLNSSKLSTIEEKEDLKKSLEKHLLYKSQITEARWPVKTNELLKNFRIVDTPGLIQNLLGETKISINEYYHKADGVIWVLDANKISAQKSRELLEEINSYMEEIGGTSHNMVAVLNRIDNVRKQGGEEGVRKVCEEAERIFGDIFSKIIPISALQARKGIELKDEELIKESGIKELIGVISHTFLKKAKNIQIERKRLGALGIYRDLTKDLKVFREKLLQDEKNRRKLSVLFTEELKSRKKDFKDEVKNTFNNYKNKVTNNINLYTEDLFDIDNDEERRKFVEENIFQPEKLIYELRLLQESHKKSLEEFKDFYVEHSTFREFKYLKVENLVFEKCTIKTFTSPALALEGLSTDNISIASGIGISVIGTALLGPIGLILGGIAGSLGLTKFIAVKLKAPKVKEELKSSVFKSLKQLENNYIKEINNIFNNISSAINGVREESFAMLYGPSDQVPKVLGCIRVIENLSAVQIPLLSCKEIIKNQY